MKTIELGRVKECNNLLLAIKRATDKALPTETDVLVDENGTFKGKDACTMCGREVNVKCTPSGETKKVQVPRFIGKCRNNVN